MPWQPMVSSGEPNPSSEPLGDLLLRSGLRARIRTVLMAMQMPFASRRRTNSCHREGCHQQNGQGSDSFHRQIPNQNLGLNLDKRGKRGPLLLGNDQKGLARSATRQAIGLLRIAQINCIAISLAFQRDPGDGSEREKCQQQRCQQQWFQQQQSHRFDPRG